MLEIGLGVALFTAIVLMLVLVILAARSRLVATGVVGVGACRSAWVRLPASISKLSGIGPAAVIIWAWPRNRLSRLPSTSPSLFTGVNTRIVPAFLSV